MNETRTKIVEWLKTNCKNIPCEKYWLIEKLSKHLNLSHDYLNNILIRMAKENLIVVKSFKGSDSWITLIVLHELSVEWYRDASPYSISSWWFRQGKELSEKLKEKVL